MTKEGKKDTGYSKLEVKFKAKRPFLCVQLLSDKEKEDPLARIINWLGFVYTLERRKRSSQLKMMLEEPSRSLRGCGQGCHLRVSCSFCSRRAEKLIHHLSVAYVDAGEILFDISFPFRKVIATSSS